MKIFWFIMCMLLMATPLSHAQDNTDHLLDLLNTVPDLPEIRQSFITFVDYENIFEARDGTPRLQRLTDVEMLSEQVGDIFFAALNGILSGPDFIQTLRLGAGEWESLIGFDFLDIDRAITFGNPPADHDILIGEFDVDIITTAFTNRDYISKSIGDMTVWCIDPACENGVMTNIDNINPGNPFGGELGREQPVLISDTLVASAVSDIGLILIEDASADRIDSLADNPIYVAAVNSIGSDNLVLQGMFLHPSEIILNISPLMMEGDVDTVEELMEASAQLPQYNLIMIVDTVIEEVQVVYVILVYQNEEDATLATEVIPERLNTMMMSSEEQTFRDFLNKWLPTEINSHVVVDDDTGRVAAVFEFSAPKATNEETDDPIFRLIASSRLYNLFVQSIYRTDLVWLTTGNS